MKSTYRRLAIIGIIVAVLGLVFAIPFPWLFPKYGPLGMPILNTTFLYLGIVMLVVGSVIGFYGRYKYTKAEEQEDIEKAKRGQ